MINLAGRKDCDEYIVSELRKAKIDVIDASEHNGEVPYTKTGRLGKFEMSRAWYYWIVKCMVPLEIAKIIYADPACVKDVRAGGHCGCMPPETQVKRIHMKSGRFVLKDKNWDEAVEYWDMDKLRAQFISEEEMRSLGDTEECFVTCYHIDSEVGLRVFADYLRQYKLV